MVASHPFLPIPDSGWKLAQERRRLQKGTSMVKKLFNDFSIICGKLFLKGDETLNELREEAFWFWTWTALIRIGEGEKKVF